MSTNTWDVAAPGSGNYGTAGNWDPADAPSAADTLIWNGENLGDATDAAAPIDLTTGQVHVAPEHTGKLGALGTPLRLSAARMSLRGQGEMHIQGAIDQILALPDRVNGLQLTDLDQASNPGYFTAIGGGLVAFLAGSTNINDLVVMRSPTAAGDPVVTVAANSNVSAVILLAGQLQIEGTTTPNFIVVAGGELTLLNVAVMPHTVVTGSGRLIARGTEDVIIGDAGVGMHVVGGGYADFSGVLGVIGLAGNVVVGPNSFLNISNGKPIFPNSYVIIAAGLGRVKTYADEVEVLMP